jgi:hypothetical protein
MAKIKHIALTTHDIDKVASFYKDVFGMEEVGRSGSTHVYLSDGDLNLTIRSCKKSNDPDVGEQGENFSGIHPARWAITGKHTSPERQRRITGTTTTVAAVATIKPLTNHVYICQGLRPLSSSSRVKWRHVRMSMMMANTQAVVHVNATATI